jgi:hypothetical protein
MHETSQETPEFSGMFATPETGSGIRRALGRHAIGGATVSVLAGLAIWFGGSSSKPAPDPAKSPAPVVAAARASSVAERPAEPAPAPAPIAHAAPSGWQHPVAWVQNAAAKRAETQVAESFDRGMGAWGAAPHAWMPGWSHSADGFVRPGSLALFRPTLRYTDYRMDFFGQIENKSMSWVLRGKDDRNYYAMRVAIIEPGLRPVLALSHYSVVRGTAGRKVQVPLSVMAHNGVPYHISVEVKGNTYTASIEGQVVDSWSDDSLASGGVGFFSEAGARSRIYWMEVYRNDDWLGWLCGHIASGGQPPEMAGLARPALFGLPEYAELAQRP